MPTKCASLLNIHVCFLESKHGCDWTTILRPNKTLRLTMITGLGISFFQQATGNDAVVYYTDRILRDAGIVEQGPRLWATAGVGLCKTVFVIIPMLCADQLGRRYVQGLKAVAGVPLAETGCQMIFGLKPVQPLGGLGLCSRQCVRPPAAFGR